MNSLFGKTCENPENYRRFRLLYDNDLGMKIMNSLSNIKDYHFIDPDHDVLLLELMQCQIKYNKPLAIGASILDISKWYMQKFYYKVLKPFYGDHMKFLYTDTDSIIGWFKTKDIKQDLKDPRLSPHFETPETEKVPGYMKIEKTGIQMFYAICPKHYFYISLKNGQLTYNEAFKGIPAYVRKQPSQKELEEMLMNDKPPEIISQSYSLQTMRSKNHETFVMESERECSDEDDKRYYVPETYQTLPWGHRDICK
jgi:hypothetical protein